jgi:hypothetical protein
LCDASVFLSCIYDEAVLLSLAKQQQYRHADHLFRATLRLVRCKPGIFHGIQIVPTSPLASFSSIALHQLQPVNRFVHSTSKKKKKVY